MKKDDFIKKALDLIFATDGNGYPLPAHTKISKLQILAAEYTQPKNKGAEHDRI